VEKKPMGHLDVLREAVREELAGKRGIPGKPDSGVRLLDIYELGALIRARPKRSPVRKDLEEKRCQLFARIFTEP
jgi:hypothetical protein